jgi:hypothetical protein
LTEVRLQVGLASMIRSCSNRKKDHIDNDHESTEVTRIGVEAAAKKRSQYKGIQNKLG